MKAKLHQSSIALAAGLTVMSIVQAQAATNLWVGGADNDFRNALNWTNDTFPDPSVDIFRFDGVGSQGNSTITGVNVTLSNSGSAAGTSLGQILFAGAAPAMILSGGTIGLPAGTHNNAIVQSSGSSVTQTIASNIVVGDGSAATASIVNSSTTAGGLLKVAGNIAGGTGTGAAGIIAFSFGNTSGHNGNYEVTGNIDKGDATAVNVVKRGSGVLTISGVNTIGSGTSAGLGQNEAGGSILINGGTTTLNNGGDSHWGGNNVTGVAPVVRIVSGTLNAQSARNIRNSLLVEGGVLNIGASGGTSRFSFDRTNGNKTFTMTGGQLNFLADSNGGANYAVRLGNDNGANNPGPNSSYGFTGVQTGGDFVVHGRGALTQTFSLGTAESGAFVNSYTLSGGTLDLRGSVTAGVPANNAYLILGSDAPVDPNPSVGSTTFTLSGTGRLIVRANGAQGIVGSQAGAVQVLDLQGGTLVAGRMDATNLRASPAAANGTIVNLGATVSPGDSSASGRTSVVGNFTLGSGSLAIGIGGTAASTAWQDAAASGRHDQLAVTGNVVLGGALVVSLMDGFTPGSADTFTIVTGGNVTGTFGNLSGGKVALAGGATFDVDASSGTSVVLGNYTPGSGGGKTFADWAAANGVTGGPNGDSDQDGVSNLVEYALVDGDRGVLSGGTITFTKRPAPYGEDLTYSIETSTDLGGGDAWDPAVSGVTNNPSVISFTFTYGSPSRNFARLKVVQVP